MMAASLRRAWEAAGLTRPLIWNTNPLLAPMVAHLVNYTSAIVTDSTDNWLLHPDRVGNTKRIAAGYKLAGETSTLVTSTSPACEDIFEVKGGRAMWLPNGVRKDLFATALDNDNEIPQDVEALSGSVIIWVGVISENVDVELIHSVCDTFTDAILVCIGSGPAEIVDSLQAHENLKWLGFRKPEALPAYLACADIGIAPYKENAYIQHGIATKAYEYLAAGLPVVSTQLPYEKSLEPLVKIAPGHEMFLNCIREILERNSSSQSHGLVSEQIKVEAKARSDAMSNHTWSAKLELVLAKL